MIQTSIIQVKVDRCLKIDAETLFKDLGLDISSAIRLFLKQAVIKNGIPFPLTRQGDFYNSHNISHLKKVLAELDEGKCEQHNLIETN
jgi:DNA-damage-inducible protein J